MEAADIPTTQENSYVEITNKDNAHQFLRYQGYCSLCSHSVRSKQSTKLVKCKYWRGYVKMWVGKLQNFGPTLDSPLWQSSSTKGAVKQFLDQKSITEMKHQPQSPGLDADAGDAQK